MSGRPGRRSDSLGGAYRGFLLLALAGMALAVAGLVFSLSRLSSVLGASVTDLSRDAAPSMIILQSAGADLRALQGALDDRMNGDAGAAELYEEQAAGARRELDGDIEAYSRLPSFPGESALLPDIQRGLAKLDTITARIVALPADARHAPGAPVLQHALRRSVRELDAALRRTASFNAAHVTHLAAQIEDVREVALPAAVALNVGGFLAAAALVVLAHAVVRAAMAREAAARRVVEERAAELEAFSGRIAHDLTSPLMTVSLALGAVEKRLQLDSATRLLLDRATGSLASVRRLVDGLLDFARAGARPGPGAEARVDEVIGSVIDGVKPVAEEAGVALELAPLPDVRVACSPGVLTSLVSNLVQNALRAVGDRPVRRVAARAFVDPPFVRVEVEDTGPGIEAERLRLLFEAQIRGRTSGEGLGLGLATVRRLSRAHGGDVGVRSEPGRGALFWFTLPIAAPPPLAEAAPPAPSAEAAPRAKKAGRRWRWPRVRRERVEPRKAP